jgi:hypothetical protein
LVGPARAAKRTFALGGGKGKINPMPTAAACCREEIDRAGFAILSGVFEGDEVAALVHEVTAALQRSAGREDAVLGPSGGVYAARNLLTLWPPVAAVWRRPPLTDVLAAVLGPHHGLVRVLFFDKPKGTGYHA